jgi:Subunit ChlI of Mg-chelatase
MVASVLSCLLRGLKGQIVEVQVDVSTGATAFHIVGLGDAGVKEARERVRSAIRNSLLPFPPQRLTVNLAPAELRKEGSGFDLPNTSERRLSAPPLRVPAGLVGQLAGPDIQVPAFQSLLVGLRAGDLLALGLRVNEFADISSLLLGHLGILLRIGDRRAAVAQTVFCHLP